MISAIIHIHHNAACTCDSLAAECNENLVCSHWWAVQGLGAQSLISPIYRMCVQRHDITIFSVSDYENCFKVEGAYR
jgi:hypothetical protein